MPDCCLQLAMRLPGCECKLQLAHAAKVPVPGGQLEALVDSSEGSNESGFFGAAWSDGLCFRFSGHSTSHFFSRIMCSNAPCFGPSSLRAHGRQSAGTGWEKQASIVFSPSLDSWVCHQAAWFPIQHESLMSVECVLQTMQGSNGWIGRHQLHCSHSQAQGT